MSYKDEIPSLWVMFDWGMALVFIGIIGMALLLVDMIESDKGYQCPTSESTVDKHGNRICHNGELNTHNQRTTK